MSRALFFLIDIICMALFALLARIAHQSETMPLNFSGWLSTYWPFLLGILGAWLIMSLTKMVPTRLAPAGLFVWIFTVIVGLGIWALRHHTVPHWSFMMVASITSAVLLLGWRIIATKVLRRQA